MGLKTFLEEIDKDIEADKKGFATATNRLTIYRKVLEHLKKDIAFNMMDGKRRKTWEYIKKKLEIG